MTTKSFSNRALRRTNDTSSRFVRAYPSGYQLVYKEEKHQNIDTGTKSSGTIDSIGGSKWGSDGNPLWKPCSHTKFISEFGRTAALAFYSHTKDINNITYDSTFSSSSSPAQVVYTGLSDVGHWSDYMLWLKTEPFSTDDLSGLLREAVDGFWDSLNLNFEDSVLLYADAIQLVPLLGTVEKINHTLSRLARWASKELKRRPFRTVLKAAISADFIKRFVVDTTIADINMVNDVEKDVLKRLTTLQDRNLSNVLNYKVTKTIDSLYDSVTSHGRVLQNAVMVSESPQQMITRHKTSSLTLNVLAAVRYTEDPNLPAKLIAQRLGLTRPLESAWDLIPFSFVCDYFLKTGDFIHELSKQVDENDSAVAKIGSISGIWVHEKRSNRIVSNYSGTYTVVEPSFGSPRSLAGQCGIESSSYNRYALGNLWDSGGFFDGQGLWNPRLSSTRSRNLVELFIQHKL